MKVMNTTKDINMTENKYQAEEEVLIKRVTEEETGASQLKMI